MRKETLKTIVLILTAITLAFGLLESFGVIAWLFQDDFTKQ